MIARSAVNLHALAEAYVLANTPGYLLRRLRGDALVGALSSDHTTSDIAAEIDALLRREQLSFDDVLFAYALVTALTLKDYNEAYPALSSLPIGRLEWGPGILRAWDSTRSATSSGSIRIRPQIASSIVAARSDKPVVLQVNPSLMAPSSREEIPVSTLVWYSDK
jgi:hypothetical protein